ncbi:MAG: ribonuclease J [Coriobacteriia bacterium]|nr:ribonuclease J [Coriobacteriia bacterium]
MQKENNKKPQKKNKQNRNRTHHYKHVQVNKVRPKLSRGNFDQDQNKKQSTKRGSVQKDKNAKLRVIPLGGLDAIGDNMTVFECENGMILDDAGMMFPSDAHPGVDLILPDYTYVLEHADKLKAIVITHGHEDHIGCLPYLIQDLGRPVPIFATKLAIGFIKAKFEEFDIKNISFNEIKPGDVINTGCFQISFFQVNHSIPGCVGMFIQTPAGNILHTGDFKLDQTPIDGKTTDFDLISKFAKTGIDLLMSDSTNANVKEFTPSESTVGPELERIIRDAKGKVIVATFASHIHRVQQVCDAAIKCGRKVVVAGRSMVQNVEIARNLGYLHVSDEHIIDAYELDNIPSSDAVILCTGSQGEPLSALARVSTDSHKRITAEKGDTVIISATPVPGNEKAVSAVVNNLAKLGVNVVDKTIAPVHVSGHAASEELKMMISLCNPYGFMPVHGEAVHLLAHAKLAEKCGVDHDKIFLCENGDVIEMSTSGIRRLEPVQSGVVYVDGLSVGDTSQDVLKERNFLGEGGIAVVSAAINYKQKQIIGPVFVNLRGVSGGDDADLQNDLRNVVVRSINKELKKSTDNNHIRKAAKDALLSLL